MPRRIHFNRCRGQPLPRNTRLVTRPSRWGNYESEPTAKTPEAHAIAVKAFAAKVLSPEWLEYRREARENLRGLDLACACPEGWPCHADILLEIANGKET